MINVSYGLWSSGRLLHTLPLGTLPLDTLPLDTLPLDTLPLDTLPLDTLPLDTLLLDTLPLAPCCTPRRASGPHLIHKRRLSRQSEPLLKGGFNLVAPHLWRTSIKKTVPGPGSDRVIIRVLSKQLHRGKDDTLHFAPFRASDSSFEGAIVTGLVNLVE